jgi:DNA-binding transcriptional ArsR family regulator
MQRRTAPLTTAVPLFAALGDAVRLSIVARLCRDGPLPTVQLKQGADVSRQAVTKHLRMLEDVGLVHSDRVGRNRLWRIETRRLAETHKYLDQISALWDARLERLRIFVENDVK